jgi:hypothetical protein
MDSERERWLAEFTEAALRSIAQLRSAERWRAGHFSIELCPVHGSDCVRVILADVVLAHFRYVEHPAREAARVLLPPQDLASLSPKQTALLIGPPKKAS